MIKVIDHYENPRNVGSMDKNDQNVGTGLVGAPACGDVMKLQVNSVSVNSLKHIYCSYLDLILDQSRRKRKNCGCQIQNFRMWLCNRFELISYRMGERQNGEIFSFIKAAYPFLPVYL